MNEVDTLRMRLSGKDLTMFNNVVRTFEAKLADERKRADDAESSLAAVKASFPQDGPRKFTTPIGTHE